MSQLNELPGHLVVDILECFSLRPMPRDNGIACCNKALSSSWQTTRRRLLLEGTSQVYDALRAASARGDLSGLRSNMLNSLSHMSHPLVAAMIHHWVVHGDPGPPLMIGAALVWSILNHWRNDVTLWMDPQTQQEYRYRLERTRQSAHQLKKSYFSAYLWQHGFRR